MTPKEKINKLIDNFEVFCDNDMTYFKEQVLIELDIAIEETKRKASKDFNESYQLEIKQLQKENEELKKKNILLSLRNKKFMNQLNKPNGDKK